MSLPTENKITLYPEYRCRICLDATNGEIALNQTTNYKKAEISLKELLEFCMNAQVCENGKADGLCLACMEKVIVSYELKKKFEESQSILLREIEEGNSFVIKTEEDVKEEVSEQDLQEEGLMVIPKNEVLDEEILDETEQISGDIKCHADKQDMLNTPGDNATTISLQATEHQCDVCQRIFPSRASLMCHKRKKKHLEHSSQAQENTADYKCELCEQTFQLRRCLVSHVQKAHKKIAVVQRQIPCPTCGRKFSKKANLGEHMLTHA